MSASNILNTIVEQKRIEVARLSTNGLGPKDLVDLAKERGGIRDFAGALKRSSNGNIALIAEVKKASPSAGVICANFDPVRIAREYEVAGATCLSVLTDEKFFQGALSYLKEIRDAVDLPLLRKDFIVDARQIREAIEWGADAILLIVAILNDEKLKEFHSLAKSAGLSVLVEVHDDSELDRALAVGADLIGVNNRDLKTFQVDLATTERLAQRLRRGAEDERSLLVSESGIHSAEDVKRVRTAGVDAILVGESLMRHQNIGEKVSELIR